MTRAHLAQRAEARAEREIRDIPRWIWNGARLPVPVHRIAEEHYGLLVTAHDSLADYLSDGESYASGVLLVEARRILVDRLEVARSPGRGRFTIAHELGHLALRHDTREGRLHARRATSTPRPDDDEFTPRALRYPDIELEANQFAGALLMPARHVDLADDSAGALAERFAVSLPAAEVRLEYLRWANDTPQR